MHMSTKTEKSKGKGQILGIRLNPAERINDLRLPINLRLLKQRVPALVSFLNRQGHVSQVGFRIITDSLTDSLTGSLTDSLTDSYHFWSVYSYGLWRFACDALLVAVYIYLYSAYNTHKSIVRCIKYTNSCCHMSDHKNSSHRLMKGKI